MIFASWGRPDAVGPSGDLYIGFRRDGEWTPAVNIGPTINSVRTEYCPVVSHYGRYFYFASERDFADRLLPQGLDRAEWMRRLTSPGDGRG